ncbi:MAG: hypothetical protein U5Q44_11985 [Dehalococcoidia bacterium]|nr:hypothetical protein [Dehalococcoidia bacterium]
MTLALYGKSHRRQVFLVLLAITALVAATFAGSVMSGDRAQATNMPDLVVTKTNDANGQVEAGGTFAWTLTIENRGNVDAIVPRRLRPGVPVPFLRDELPSGADYTLCRRRIDKWRAVDLPSACQQSRQGAQLACELRQR